jgi:hypothetical protein
MAVLNLPVVLEFSAATPKLNYNCRRVCSQGCHTCSRVVGTCSIQVQGIEPDSGVFRTRCIV